MAVNNPRHSQQHRRLTGGLGANCRRADKGKAPGPLSPTLASRYVFSLRLYETNSSERIAPAAVRRNRWAFSYPPLDWSLRFSFFQIKNCHRVLSPVAEVPAEASHVA